MARTLAYCRLSANDQTTENQVREIACAGFAVDPKRVVHEVVSGLVAARERTGFNKLTEKLESGDLLVVTKLNGLGRNALDVRSTVEKLRADGVRVHCLALGGADLTSLAGRIIMNVICAMADFEQDLLLQRTQSGLARAKAAGTALGRPCALSANAQEEILHRRLEGVSLGVLAKRYGVSRSTIRRVESRLRVDG